MLSKSVLAKAKNTALEPPVLIVSFFIKQALISIRSLVIGHCMWTFYIVKKDIFLDSFLEFAY
jgi:hypothetical protein